MTEPGSDGGPDPTIMVVDDEPSNLQLVKFALMREKFPCNLVLLGSAAEALDYLGGHSVNLIVLDVMMPEMDGFETFQRIKDNPAWADIPVIFLSAVHEPRYIIRGLEMGAVDYIGKPMISQVLTARFQAVLRTRYLQRELKRRNAELESANRLKDEFLSFCSHDLRAPMSAIELTCQMLSDTAERVGSGEAQELIGRIVNQTRLARRLVENLLDMNKLDEGKLIPRPTFFAPRELLRGCIEDHRPMILAKGLTLDLDCQAAEAIGFGDREMIAQAIRNILGNAVKYAQGNVRMQSRLEGLSGEDAGTWTVSITDDGPGFPGGDAESIFRKYSHDNQGGAGYGLGLYIAQQTAGLHQGEISAESRPDDETTLTLRLPIVFRRDALPDLSRHSDASVRIIAGAKETAELLEHVLLEVGLVDVEQCALACDPAQEFGADPPDLAVVDLASSAVETAPLMRFIDRGHSLTRWIFFGSAEELTEVARLAGPAIAGLRTPPNPIAYLRTVKALMDDRLEPMADSG